MTVVYAALRDGALRDPALVPSERKRECVCARVIRRLKREVTSQPETEELVTWQLLSMWEVKEEKPGSCVACADAVVGRCSAEAMLH